ncbi:MAG: GntR family transcriptional regulator [bacterium]|nr:MAG: GntR family transcriptional regulator [bacterium]
METEHFLPVARRKVSDEIFLMLQEKIFLGALKPGEKLPPERELSRQLGVTRVPLREALKRLQAMKLIEVRHGDGIYVLDYQSNGSFEFLMSVIQSGLPLEQRLVKSLLEFRLIVVPELFRLAAKNATEENIKKLEEIIEKEKQSSSNRNRLMELDFEFHTEVARASGNLFAQLLYNSLRPVYLTLSAQFFHNIPNPQQVPIHAEMVLAALKAHDGETLARNTRYFLELANDFMLANLNA